MNNTPIALVLIYIVVLIAGIIGWVLNLIAVIKLAIGGAALTTLFVLRIVGLFAFPVGGVLGYF